MTVRIECKCGHKENVHSDLGCQFPDCRCKEWRQTKPITRQVPSSKRNAETATQKLDSKLAIKSRKYQSHKKPLRDESDKIKTQQPSKIPSISNYRDKFRQDEKTLEEINKLQEKHEWKKIDEQLELKLKRDHENVDTWIEKGINYRNWQKYQDAIHCFKNALMFDNKQDNSTDKKNYQIYNNLGEIYYEIKDYPEAVKNCKESLKIKLDYLPALMQLGYIYRDIPNYEYSKIYFEKVLQQKSNNIDSLDNLGYLYEQSKEWKKAIDYYEESRKAKDEDDGDIWADVRIAACYLEKKDLGHAELLINKERVRKNETKDSCNVRGNICKSSKKYEEAIENYELEFDWSNNIVRGDIWFDLGFCNQQTNNLELAIKYYKKYIEISGLTATAAQNIGNAYRDLKQYDASENYYNLGIKKFPGTVAILQNKVALHMRQSQYDDAIKCCDEILEIEQDLWTLNQKGFCLGNKGEHNEAIKIFEEIQEAIAQGNVPPIALEKNGIFEEDLLNAIGWEWIQMGENQKGLDFVEQALDINSKKWHIIDSKAVALKNLGRFEEAKKWYEKVFEITKEEEDEMKIAICHRQIGNKSNEDEKEKYNIESIKILNSILEKNNLNSEALYEKALSYWNLKQYEESKKCIKSAIKINPNKMKYWFELGEIAYVENKLLQAMFFYDKCIELEPTTESYKQKADLLFDLKKYEESIESYNIAIDTYDKTKLLFPFAHKENIISRIWNGIRNSWSQLKKYQEAIDGYDKSLEYDENNHETITNKGNQLRKMKKYDDAIDCFNYALEIHPKYYRTQFLKIVTYTEWKKYDDAEELAKKVETQHPDEIEATTELLMEIYEKTGETSKQKEYQEKLDKIRDLKNNETDGK